MNRRVIVLAACLFGIAFLGARSISAQVRNPSALTLAQPQVIAGPDVGFRIVRMEGSTPVGQVVVRINGAWVAAEVSPK
jgi:hypothetical protein